MAKLAISSVTNINFINVEQALSLLDVFCISHPKHSGGQNIDNYKLLITECPDIIAMTIELKCHTSDILFCFDTTDNFVAFHDDLNFSSHCFDCILPSNLEKATFAKLSFVDKVRVIAQLSMADENGMLLVPWSFLCKEQMLSAAEMFSIKLTSTQIQNCPNIANVLSAKIRRADHYKNQYGKFTSFASICFDFSTDNLFCCIGNGKDAVGGMIGQFCLQNTKQKKNKEKASSRPSPRTDITSNAVRGHISPETEQERHPSLVVKSAQALGYASVDQLKSIAKFYKIKLELSRRSSKGCIIDVIKDSLQFKSDLRSSVITSDVIFCFDVNSNVQCTLHELISSHSFVSLPKSTILLLTSSTVADLSRMDKAKALLQLALGSANNGSFSVPWCALTYSQKYAILEDFRDKSPSDSLNTIQEEDLWNYIKQSKEFTTRYDTFSFDDISFVGALKTPLDISVDPTIYQSDFSEILFDAFTVSPSFAEEIIQTDANMPNGSMYQFEETLTTKKNITNAGSYPPRSIESHKSKIEASKTKTKLKPIIAINKVSISSKSSILSQEIISEDKSTPAQYTIGKQKDVSPSPSPPTCNIGIIPLTYTVKNSEGLISEFNPKGSDALSEPDSHTDEALYVCSCEHDSCSIHSPLQEIAKTAGPHSSTPIMENFTETSGLDLVTNENQTISTDSLPQLLHSSRESFTDSKESSMSSNSSYKEESTQNSLHKKRPKNCKSKVAKRKPKPSSQSTEDKPDTLRRLTVDNDLVIQIEPREKSHIKNGICLSCMEKCKNETLKCFVCSRKVHFSCYKSQGKKPLGSNVFINSLDLTNHKWFCNKCVHLSINDILMFATHKVKQNIKDSCDFMDVSNKTNESPDREAKYTLEKAVQVQNPLINSMQETATTQNNQGQNYSFISDASDDDDHIIQNHLVENQSQNYMLQNLNIESLTNRIVKKVNEQLDKRLAHLQLPGGTRENPQPHQSTYASNLMKNISETSSVQKTLLNNVKSTTINAPNSKSQVNKHNSLVIRNIQDRKFIKDSPSIKREFNNHFKDTKIVTAFPTRSGTLIIELESKNDVEQVAKGWKSSFFQNVSSVADNEPGTSCEIMGDIQNLKVILKNVDLDLSDEQITSELSEQFNGASFKRFINRNKKPLKVGVITLSCHQHLIKLLEGEIFLCNLLMKTEEYIPRRKVIQCYNCKKFDHVQKWCPHSHSCINCSKPHSDIDCKTPAQITCANCKQNHSSFDKNCPVYLQKVKINNVLIHHQLNE